jgi:hypothetical protein
MYARPKKFQYITILPILNYEFKTKHLFSTKPFPHFHKRDIFIHILFITCQTLSFGIQKVAVYMPLLCGCKRFYGYAKTTMMGIAQWKGLATIC